MDKVEIKKKHKEDWDTVTKKIAFDTSYRFNVAWWIMFWIFCGLCTVFLVFGLVVFAGSMTGWDTKLCYALGLGCGFSTIFIFALFWITNNFVNSRMFVRPEYPQEVKGLIKKQAIWMNVFRVSTAVLCLACGVMYIVAGYMWEANSGVPVSTIQIINGCTCLLFLILAGVSIAGCYEMIVIKFRTLDMLVPKK